ncbi:hypothetical protein QFC19_005493 [Naganishia cerealis]|uniref:Uncharacterized protein n=1 Tax=Naganishia cerealis TaxID=610337 RepID=A0ACC2VP19_9TREE|nr:hypothetical protein QFC19_005493 [Naganishia cerealis]
MDQSQPAVTDVNSPSEVGNLNNPSNSGRKRAVPESSTDTALFIKRRAIKVKPSARKVEDDDVLLLGTPPKSPVKNLGISIKGIASNITPTQVEYTASPQINKSMQLKEGLLAEEAIGSSVQDSIPKPRTASPEFTVYTPPIDFKSFPRSSLVPPRSQHPPLLPCRSVYEYTRLNRIEEGTYGIVSRARCNATGGIYALKKLKLEEEKAGFPITSLREVMALMTTGAHENVVGVREIVVGDSLDQYVVSFISSQGRIVVTHCYIEQNIHRHAIYRA